MSTPQIAARVAAMLALVISARLVWAADPGLLFLGVATAIAAGWAGRLLEWLTEADARKRARRG